MNRGKLLVWEPAEGADSPLDAHYGAGIDPSIDDAIDDPNPVLGKTGLIARTRVVLGSPLKPRAEDSPAATSFLDKETASGGMFYGSHPRMEELRAALPQIARCDVPVLIHGETGTGKEVVARQIHRLSDRANRPFVKLNCAAVPSELAESELFGYERGAFTGAHQRKPGIFEMANGGTVMLDEIGDMDFRLQAKLLQVLQDQEFRRVGGTETVRVDVRVISATHRDLRQAGRENTFRPDLFYRLNGFSITVPSLRDRREDILDLAQFLYRRHVAKPRESASCEMPYSPALEHAFLNYDWPGNIRELEMTVRKLAVMGDPAVVVSELRESAHFAQSNPAPNPRIPGYGRRASDIRTPDIRTPDIRTHANRATDDRAAVNQPARPQPNNLSIIEHASRAKQETEAGAIRSALQAARWNRKQAAVILNIDYKALLYKMKKLGIR